MKRIIFSLLAISAIVSVSAQSNEEDSWGLLNIKSTGSYDSLMANWYNKNIVESYSSFVDEFINLEDAEVSTSGMLPDAVYETRLKMLATAIQLPYNDVVKKYINVYTNKRAMMERILGLAQYYFPYIEEILDKNGLPLELKMLPIIESALNPKAVSSQGATGLWQFMLRTGRSYGLEVNTFVDERSNVEKSTEAACKYLKDLYGMYGDWTLVIAAYNCGQGNVNKALKRAPNARTYWDIYYLLPRETRGYIPAFIAATYAYTFHKSHNMTPKTLWYPTATDTVMVDRMLHLQQVSKNLNIPMEVIRELNPQYKIDIIPGVDKKYPLTLPMNYLTEFIEKQPQIYAQDSVYLAQYMQVSNLDEAQAKAVQSGAAKVSSTSAKTHKVKSGETLGALAKKYKVSVKQLMAWNKIKSASSLRIGQTLRVK